MHHKHVEVNRPVADHISYLLEYQSLVETPSTNQDNYVVDKKSNIWMISSCLYLLLDFEWLFTK
jgi:hypothetical protein